MSQINPNFSLDQAASFGAETGTGVVNAINYIDGKTLEISLADFGANPARYLQAFEAIPNRPLQIQFVE